MRHLAMQPRSIMWLALVSLSLVASAEDWPTYRHDASRAGASGETLAVNYTHLTLPTNREV